MKKVELLSVCNYDTISLPTTKPTTPPIYGEIKDDEINDGNEGMKSMSWAKTVHVQVHYIHTYKYSPIVKCMYVCMYVCTVLYHMYDIYPVRILNML